MPVNKLFDPDTLAYLQQAPSDDLIARFLRTIVDWTSEKLKVDASVSIGAVSVDLDATGDNVEVKGRDKLNALKSILTSSAGHLIVQDNGASNLEVDHAAQESVGAPPAVTTVSLTSPVAVRIVNTGDYAIELSWDDGTHWYPLYPKQPMGYEANNSTFKVRATNAVGGTFKVLYMKRV